MTRRVPYCGAPAPGFSAQLGALTRRAPALPDWPQFAGRTVVSFYQARVALRHLCDLWGLGPGCDVLVPSYNCGTEVDPAVRSGARVIPYRVDRGALVDVDDVRARATDRTRVLYVTHYFGWEQPLDDLLPWCRERDIALVEDCALALFADTPGRRLGTRGDAAVFSLQKFLPSPPAGVLSLSAAMAPGATLRAPPIRRTVRDALPLLKGAGMRAAERLGLSRRPPSRAWSPLPPSPTPARLPDMPRDYYFDEAAAGWDASRLARGLLRDVDPADVRDRRRRNYGGLRDRIAALDGLEPLYDDLPVGVCPFGLPVLVEDRRRWVDALVAHGIPAFPFWEGYHRGLDWDEFPDARHLKDHVLVLPIHQQLTEVHVDYIAETIAALRTRL